VSYLGFLAGAGLSWNSESDLSNFTQLLSFYAFQDTTDKMGNIAYDLGNVYKKVGYYFANNSGLFLILVFCGHKFGKMALENTSTENLKKAKEAIVNIVKTLDNVKMVRKDAKLIKLEYRWAIDMLSLACDLGVAQLESGIEKPITELEGSFKEELKKTLNDLIERHQEIWLQRNRPGGLSDSVNRLQRVINLFE
jgi:hypothetical protein